MCIITSWLKLSKMGNQSDRLGSCLVTGLTWKLTAIICLCCLWQQCVDSKIVEGTLKTKEDWEFLTRFCFLSEDGKMDFEFSFPQALKNLRFEMYFDEQWPNVYKKEKNCSEKAKVLNTGTGSNQMMRFGAGVGPFTCSYTGGVATCYDSRPFSSARDRWWFFAVSNCGDPQNQGLNVRYKLTLTNSDDEDDTFFYHFSADKFYILPVDIAFLILNCVLLALCIFVAVKLRERHFLHSTFRLYLASVCCQVAHLIIMCCYNGAYSVTGREYRNVEYLGRGLEGICMLIFLLLLILLAKGYTITRGRLSRKSSVLITIFFIVYIIAFIIIFLYDRYVFDEGQVLYLYESPPGYALIALRLLGLFWFAYAIYFTLKNYPKKRLFYMPFIFYYITWFLLGPAVIIIAMKVIGVWMREQVVSAVENMVMLAGHIFILVLTWPSLANKYFPYHVRTTQINVMSDAMAERQSGAPGAAQNKDLDSYAAYSYAPSEGPVTQRQPDLYQMFEASAEGSGLRLAGAKPPDKSVEHTAAYLGSNPQSYSHFHVGNGGAQNRAYGGGDDDSEVNSDAEGTHYTAPWRHEGDKVE